MAKPKASHQGSINWALVGDKVCEVLVIARDNPPGLVEFAREQSVPYESVVAAAIAQMVADYVEAELAKKITQQDSQEGQASRFVTERLFQRCSIRRFVAEPQLFVRAVHQNKALASALGAIGTRSLCLAVDGQKWYTVLGGLQRCRHETVPQEATMVINVNIPDSTERMLAEQAAMRGQSVESYAAELIRKGVSGSRTFAEILAPFRDQVHSSEIQDAELDGLLESARDEVHEARQGHK